ncbi:MAG: PCRF domain-containing protein, partial [Bryobacterales bacterium]|nr:PCRF domain-containing protein [Bryobacterales bacterium]
MTTAAPSELLEKLRGIEEHYRELLEKLSDPAVIANSREYAQLAKERAQLDEVARAIGDYRKLLDDIGEHRELLEGG